jgi:hypothetical protein
MNFSARLEHEAIPVGIVKDGFGPPRLLLGCGLEPDTVTHQPLIIR